LLPNITALGSQLQVNTNTLVTQELPSVAAQVDGDFLVVWGSPEWGSSIQGRSYASDGSDLSGEFQVASAEPFSNPLFDCYEYVYLPSVSARTPSDFVVVRQSDGSSGRDSDGTSIRARLFVPEPYHALLQTMAFGTLLMLSRRR
jgi:hypothetical protein